VTTLSEFYAQARAK